MDLTENVLTTEKVEDIQRRSSMGEKIKNTEKIWLDNKIGVRRSNLSFAMTEYETMEYMKCAMSVQYFAQTYCQIKREDGSIGPIKLRDYQQDIIDLFTGNKYSILCASRQLGKTASAAIVILHFVLFNNDKNVMIVANVSKTVKEIVNKIKDIYKLVPFYLKKGVSNWNEKSVVFDNGSRILSESRTTSPSIGFNIDFLYMDEFAKVPANIINPYYRSVIPTVSSIKNSKIIITSTPDGYNLFHELLSDAMREEDDPLKNEYTALMIYWWQAKGRRDTKLKPLQKKLDFFKIKWDDVLAYLAELGYSTYIDKFDSIDYTMIVYDKEDENTHIHNIKTLRYNNIPFEEFCMVTNWQEEQTKLIGGEDNFKQEYDLQFITGNKLLFDSMQIEILKKRAGKFEYLDIDKFDRKLPIPYNSLKWIKNRPDLFNLANVKNYNILASVDLGEGLGQDFTVINIFRLCLKPKELIEKTKKKIATIYDLFQLEQIGLFRSNLYSIEEIAHMFYMIFFELFDPEKTKVALEYNTYGGKLLSELPHVFKDANDFSNAIFFRYKHRKEDDKLKIGIKITKGENESSKKILIKALQDAIKKDLIVLNNDMTINELTVFSRKDTPSGDFTYQCESGNDDITMSLVNLSSVFSQIHYKNMIDSLSLTLSETERRTLDEFNSMIDDGSVVDYNSTASSYNKIYNRPKPTNNTWYNGNIGPSPWANRG